MENGLSYQHQTWYTCTGSCSSVGVHWPKVQRSKGRFTVTKTATVACLLVAAVVRDCTSYDCLGF